MNEKLNKSLEDKAYGFYFNEESSEYEMVSAKKYFLCKQNQRLYFDDSFLKIKIEKIFSGSVKISFVNFNLKFVKPVKFESFKNKKQKVFVLKA